MATDLVIRHTHAEGTILEGTDRSDADVLRPILRGSFRWSRQMGAWIIQRSRDSFARETTINTVAAGLREAGFAVTVEIDNTVTRTAAERHADQEARSEQRTEGLAAAADRRAVKADEMSERARQGRDMIPLGQPVMPGHHSYKSDINRRAKLGRLENRAMETAREADDLQRASDAAAATAAARATVGATRRRIERLEAEQRDIVRKLAGQACSVTGRKFKPEATVEAGDILKCPICEVRYTVVIDGNHLRVGTHFAAHHGPAEGEWEQRLRTRHDIIADELAHEAATIDRLADSGVKVWSRDDFAKGDMIHTRGRWEGPVTRVNAKSVTVPGFFGGTSTVGYDEINGRAGEGDDNEAAQYARANPRRNQR